MLRGTVRGASWWGGGGGQKYVPPRSKPKPGVGRLQAAGGRTRSKSLEMRGEDREGRKQEELWGRRGGWEMERGTEMRKREQRGGCDG